MGTEPESEVQGEDEWTLTFEEATPLHIGPCPGCEQRDIEITELRRLLLECHGWMAGVEPRPAAPFMREVFEATKGFS